MTITFHGCLVSQAVEERNGSKMIYLELYWEFFQVGLFSIGGGYAALPLIQARVVDTHNWLSLAEFTDVVTISQMTPGPIGINAATFVGTKMAGILGSLVATAGCVTPSFIIVLCLAYVYTKYNNLDIIQGILGGLRPAVVGLIAASGLSITILCFFRSSDVAYNLRSLDVFAVVLFAAGFFVLRKFKLNPIYVMLGSGAVGLAAYFIQIVI